MSRSTAKSDELSMEESKEAERFQGLKETGDIEKADLYYDDGLSPEQAFDITEDPEAAGERAAGAGGDDDDDKGGDDSSAASTEDGQGKVASGEDDERTPTDPTGAALNSVLVEQAKARGFSDAEIAVFQTDAQLAVAVLRTNGQSAEQTLDEKGAESASDGKWTLKDRDKYDEDFADALEEAVNDIRDKELKPIKEQMEAERANATARWLDNQIEAHGDDAVKLFGKDMSVRGEGTKERQNYLALLHEVNAARKIMGPEASSEEVIERVMSYKFNVTQKKQSEKAVRDKLAQRQTTLTQRTTSKKAHELPKGRARAEAMIGAKLAQYGLDGDDGEDDLDAFL